MLKILSKKLSCLFIDTDLYLSLLERSQLARIFGSHLGLAAGLERGAGHGDAGYGGVRAAAQLELRSPRLAHDVSAAVGRRTRGDDGGLQRGDVGRDSDHRAPVQHSVLQLQRLGIRGRGWRVATLQREKKR